MSYKESLVVLLCATGGYAAMKSNSRTSLADHKINPMLPDSPQARSSLLQDIDCTEARNPELSQTGTERLSDHQSFQEFLDTHFNSVDHPQWYQNLMSQEDTGSAGEDKCLVASDYDLKSGKKYDQPCQQEAGLLLYSRPDSLNDLSSGVFLPDSDNQKGIQPDQYSARLTPGQDIFSFLDLGSQGKSPFPASHGLPGINHNKGKAPPEFLEHPVTPAPVEATAYMQYKNYKDPDNISGTKELLRFLVEKSANAAMVYSLLLSAFGGSSAFLTKNDFIKDYVHRGSIKLGQLFKYLLNKQKTIDNASQTAEGAVGGATSAFPESGNAEAEKAMGYAIAQQIRHEWPRNRGEKLDSLLANFPEPVEVNPAARQPPTTQRLLEHGVPVWRGGADSVTATIGSAGGTIMLAPQGPPKKLDKEELESICRALGIPREELIDDSDEDENMEAHAAEPIPGEDMKDSDEDESMEVDPK